MNGQQVGALSDLQQRILAQNKEMDMLSQQRSGGTERAQPVRASYGAPPKLKNAEPGSVEASQGALPRRNLSESRRNAGGDSNFRNAGEQAILRNSTMNNMGIKMETAPKQDYPTGGANLPPSGKSGPATGAPGKPPMAGGANAGENVRTAAGPPTVPNGGAPSFELEPIENYKGKSVGELEAILDAHNAA